MRRRVETAGDDGLNLGANGKGPLAATETNFEQRSEDWTEPSDQQAERELAIGRRLGNWKTLASFGFAVLVLLLVVLKGGIDPTATWRRLRTLNLGLFLGA